MGIQVVLNQDLDAGDWIWHITSDPQRLLVFKQIVNNNIIILKFLDQ
jgi:hypothetical protein